MSSLRFWVVAVVIVLGLPATGAPVWLVILAAGPFALLAGWTLVPGHICGWCGRHFDGPYDWCCPECAREPKP